MKLPNPLVPGFNPDPSVVRVGDHYYLVTSSFEYVPGIPVYHSTDLCDWQLIGHVITRPEQFDAQRAPTNGGIWAPTIRWRDGVFYVIVATMESGTRIHTATDPVGPWSDGTPITAIRGIDPDIAWDDEGTCYITFSGLILGGPDAGSHVGIQQVRVDPHTGETLEEPRPMWSGTGLMFPEAPHLYRIGDWWYLMIAEGGTERGHAVSIARSRSPAGPFEGCPANPVLSARSTDRPVQNTGHGDLVVAPDGTWSMVLLGMRTAGITRSFSALGRESFGTHVDWVDGWPVVDPVVLSDDRAAPEFNDDFNGSELGPEWIGVRRHPASIARLGDGSLVIAGEGRTMSHPSPTFVGRRQRRRDARISTVVTGDGAGGLTLRYDERHHVDVEVEPGRVIGRACLPTIRQEHHVDVPYGEIELALEIEPTVAAFDPGSPTDMSRGYSCDTIRLVATGRDGVRHQLVEIDGRYLTAESACSFTGRVAGMYCESGELGFHRYRETPCAPEARPS